MNRLLESEPGFEVVADCATIEDALLVIRKKSVDIVLLDFDFGQRDGWDFLRFAAEQEFKGKQWWSRQEWRPPLCLS